jgi:solute carrier family 12 sodium/potassium/chloride transporter 2
MLMSSKGYSFGTFQGVFVPSILTILGVIMYLRFGWVLAHAGIFLTLVIVTLATSITFFTSLSLAALVSNSPVGSGGAYYLISRSLGIEAGAAIGLPLFLAQALGVSFYVSGFSESIHALMPAIPTITVSLVTLLFLTILVFFSADLALKSQLVILVLIALSMVSFFAGSAAHLPVAVDGALPVPDIGFWVIFAVFFPAVTGIEAGLGLSGDLKNPTRSLTWGTIAAVCLSYVVYMAIPIFISRQNIPDGALGSNSMIMADIARWRWLVIAGLWGATLSSAMGTLLSAPRTLQSISNDRLLPRFIGRGYGINNEPRTAIVISFVLAACGIMLGNLNTIAPILSMFFLTSYGLINTSAFIENIAGGPWWRPTFKTPWFLSAIGAFACFAAMFMINPGATFISLFVCVGIFALVRRRRLAAHWGDVRTGLLMWIAQHVVYKLSLRTVDERTWRPNLLVFTGSPRSRWHLVVLADSLSRARGFATFVSMVSHETTQDHAENVRATVKNFLLDQGVEGIIKILPANDTYAGALSLIECYGFGPLRPNTVILGAPGDFRRIDQFIGIIRHCAEKHLNVMILQAAREPLSEPDETSRIDVWWDPVSANAGLLLALGYLFKSNRRNVKKRLIVRTLLPHDAHGGETRSHIEKMVARMRLDAEIKIEDSNGRHHLEIIAEKSRDASFVFLGFKAPEEQQSPEVYRTYFENLIENTRGFPPTALVMAKEKLDFDHLFIE